jgi:hypothetical protein
MVAILVRELQDPAPRQRIGKGNERCLMIFMIDVYELGLEIGYMCIFGKNPQATPNYTGA